MKQKLTNTLKHAHVSTTAGGITLVALWLLGVIFSDYEGGLSWFACVVWIFGVLNYEKNQYLDYVGRNHIKLRGAQASKNIFKRIWSDLKRVPEMLKWSNLKQDLAPLMGYLRLKWLDTIVDILVGIIPFLLIMKAGGMI